MTYKAFHYMADCFGFSRYKDKKHLFALLNHESSFILNNRSERGARCYGQLTLETANEINKRIYLSNNVHHHWKSRIYKEALDKCPSLPENVHIPDSVRPKGSGKERKENNFRKVQRKYTMTCRLTQHAPTCLFYTMYNIKMNMRQITKTLKIRHSRYCSKYRTSLVPKKGFFTACQIK